MEGRADGALMGTRGDIGGRSGVDGMGGEGGDGRGEAERERASAGWEQRLWRRGVEGGAMASGGLPGRVGS